MDLSLLIVDDERQIRLGLQRTIDWEQIGITSVFVASNAQEGISMFYRYRPQIVLMDILMPGIDGLEACARIKREDKAVRVFVITGHLTTDYVRQALSLGVEEYFVKPVKIDELVRRIGDAATELVEQGFRDSLSADWEAERNRNTLARLLRGGVAPTQMQMDMLGLCKPGTRKRMIIADIHADYEAALRVRASLNWHLGRQRIYSVSALLPAPNGFALAVLTEYDRESVRAELLRALYEIINGGTDDGEGSVEINIALGRESCEWSIAGMFAALSEAIENAYYFGANSLIEEEKVGEAREFRQPYNQTLRDIAALACPSHMIAETDALFGEMWMCGARAIPRVRALAAELLMEIVRQGGEAFRAEAYRKYLHPFFCGRGRYLADDLGLIYDAFTALREASNDVPQAIRRISKYIEENYTHDLAVSEISKNVGLSKNYVSYLYKKVCGKTIIQSLNEARIAQAKRLMGVEGLSLYDISNAIGYNNYTYFTRIFRQIAGMAPSTYRLEVLSKARSKGKPEGERHEDTCD